MFDKSARYFLLMFLIFIFTLETSFIWYSFMDKRNCFSLVWQFVLIELVSHSKMVIRSLLKESDHIKSPLHNLVASQIHANWNLQQLVLKEITFTWRVTKIRGKYTIQKLFVIGEIWVFLPRFFVIKFVSSMIRFSQLLNMWEVWKLVLL